MRLFNGIDGITVSLECAHGFDRILVILPLHGLFRAECGLMQFRVGRAAAYAAEQDALDTHRVGRAEHSAYVMLAAHIVQHHHQRQFVRFAVLVNAHASHFGCGQFFTHSSNGRFTRSMRASSSISTIKSSWSGSSRPSSSVASVLMVDSSIAAITPIVFPSSSIV